MVDKEIQELIGKYLNGSATPEERGALESWYTQYSQQNREIDYTEALLARKNKGLEEILAMKQVNPAHNLSVRPWKWLSIAAAVLLMMSAGIWFYLGQLKVQPVKPVLAYVNDIAPGKNTATLTLANGKKILLSDAVNGELAKESGVVISKTADGQLIYEIREQGAGQPNQMNTLTTARGEQYRLLLPDGTNVWLNAESSLKFPSTFTGQHERKVELLGEGYFEVQKNANQPFMVSTPGQQVQVLGTHFNVNAYGDENRIKTTLLEGSVKINGSTILKPGEESSLLKSGSIQVKEVDVENAISWKEGYFRFDRKDLRSIMLNISRWYDVDVIYKEQALENLTFSGTVSRYSSVSKILEILELSKEVHFIVEGRRIIVVK